MNKEKVIAHLQELALDVFNVRSIDEVNHNPHPYMVGAKHVVHASDHHSSILDERTMNVVGCAHPCCGMDYISHTFDTVVFLSLKRNVTNEEGNKIMKSFLPVTDKENIDGFAFVETEEKFRFLD